MIGFGDEVYLPDEVLADPDVESDLEMGDEETPELDFENPYVARNGYEEMVSDIGRADELFEAA